MKRYIMLVFHLAIVSFFISCDESGVDGPNVVLSESMLIGEWEQISFKVDGKEIPDDRTYFIIFKDDGAGTYLKISDDAIKTEFFNWTFNSNKLCMEYESASECMDVEFVGDFMTFTAVSAKGETIKIMFMKYQEIE